MCGLAGFQEREEAPAEALTARVSRMADALRHRGPDDSGVFVDAGAGLALGFRRLAILDRSPTGHQPMASPDGRFVIAFNGEIYNHGDLRQQLQAEGVRFRGRSDTEVLLAVAATRGVERMFADAWGMFAIALWDSATRTLYLGRDRVGKKPLYYAELPPQGGRPAALLFGSELKALRAHPRFDDRLDREALAGYFRYACVPDPASIYRTVRKAPAGAWLVCRDGAVVRTVRYWSAVDVARAGLADRASPSAAEALDDLDQLLRDAVRRRMEADVPLGAFLSGGIDSSIVVALMQAQSARPVRTFTIGVEADRHNEAAAARAVAAHLGTEHTELVVTAAAARAVIPRLPRIFDEPFGDSSQIPTLLVSELARRDVTVSLSGDGGDEIFGGYTRYAWAERLWRRLASQPQPLRRSAARLMEAVPPGWYDAAYGAMRPLAPSRLQQSLPGDKAHKLAAVLDVAGPDDLYRRLLSQWTDPSQVVIDGHEADVGPSSEALRLAAPNFTDRMMLLDQTGYLPSDILVKVDRASMAVGLEARAPLLDHRLIEWAWRLPLDMKRRDHTGKWLLRRLLHRYVPKELVERPKTGFGVPIDAWLRGPLRDWASALIEPARLTREGVLRSEPIARLWREHQGGRRNHQHRLWAVLMFQAWREEWSVTL